MTPRCASTSLPPSATMYERRAVVVMSRLRSVSGRLTFVDAVRDVDARAADEREVGRDGREDGRRQRVDERVLQRPEGAARDDHREAGHRLLERQGDREAVGHDDDPLEVVPVEQGQRRSAWSWCRRRARRSRPTRTSDAARTPIARLASMPTALSSSNGRSTGDGSTRQGAAVDPRRASPSAARLSRSVRIVTSESRNSRASSAVRTKPRGSTRSAMRSRRRSPGSGAGCVGSELRSTPSVSYAFTCFRNCKRETSQARARPRRHHGAHRRSARRRSPTAASSSTSTTPTPRSRPERTRRRAARSTRGPTTATMRQDVAHGRVGLDRGRRARTACSCRPAELDPLAPASATNPSEIPDLYDVAVFENRSPSFGPPLDGAPTRPPASTTSPSLGLGRTRTQRRPLRGRLLQPRDARLVRRASAESRARTVVEAWADRTEALSALPGIAAGLPVREPRRGHRRHAAPPARPDLRLPLRHAAHHARCCAASTPYGPTLFADILETRAHRPARRARRRALHRVRAVRGALARSRCTCCRTATCPTSPA